MSKTLNLSHLKFLQVKCSKFIRLVCLFIFIHFSGQSQNHKLASSVGVTRFDFFHSLEYSYDTNRFEYSAGIGYGINRTLFQQKIFPRIAIGFQYNVLNKERFHLGPVLTYAFSCIKYTQSSKFVLWNDLSGGINWSYGNQWKIGQTITAGYVGESIFSTIQNKRVVGKTWSYYFDLKLIHVL